ncbi:androgen-dependent TFPI-regulating protein [Plutella xylostella]|uniref:androgen-dependent TFPI-regulating protein n=1 Tax=Plutella xylostella TaxID=51655 RepID=UPI002032F372|nr:androgen-dependent TFPI-regulating protein [Plutella xylostella]
MAVLHYVRMFAYTATIVVHVTNIAYMIAAHDLKTHEDENVRIFGSLQFRYFTCWNFFLQIVFAITGLTSDYLELKNQKNKTYAVPRYLRGFRETLFSGVLWPSTFLVFTLFWTLFLYDRELILPPFVDKVLTRTSNHIIHTFIVPVVLWEIVFRSRNVPKNHRKNILHLVFHMMLYLSVLLYTYYERGIWIYPIFKILYKTIYFPVLILIIVFACLGFYHMQWIVVRILWNKETSKRKTKKIS